MRDQKTEEDRARRGAVDVAVAYRIYPKVSRPTPVFPEDKYRLARLCLESFRRSLGSLRVKVWAILDGCPPEYEELFREVFAPEELECVHLDAAGNQATFEKQVEILLEQDEADLVYFCEDDYFYRPGAFESLVSFVREHPDAHFVSPYDHRDYYTLGVHRGPVELRASGEHHWRTAASTCLTFLTTKETLRRTQGVLRSFTRGNSDTGLWLSLTKHAVRSPLRFLRHVASDRVAARAVFHAWRHGAGEVCFGRRWKLWVPLPSAATHMDVLFLAPGVDWGSLMQPEVERISRHAI